MLDALRQGRRLARARACIDERGSSLGVENGCSLALVRFHVGYTLPLPDVLGAHLTVKGFRKLHTGDTLRGPERLSDGCRRGIGVL